MLALIFIVIGSVILILLVWSIYNRLVKAKYMVDEAFSGIDVQLKKRFELIPNLIEAVKGYNIYEASTLSKIVDERTKNSDLGAVLDKDKSITETLRSIRISIESYPELKANNQFLDLMKNLSTVENELAMSRNYYNGTVRAYNTEMEMFPAIVFAGIMGFEKATFYLIEENERKVGEIDIRS